MLHPQMAPRIWEIFSQAEVNLRLKRQLSLPNVYFEGQGRVGPRLHQPPPVCFPTDRPDPSGNQANQGTQTLGFPNSPVL